MGSHPPGTHMRVNVCVLLEKRPRMLGLSDPFLVVISPLWRMVVTPAWQRRTEPGSGGHRRSLTNRQSFLGSSQTPRAPESRLRKGQAEARGCGAQSREQGSLWTLPPACSRLPAQVPSPPGCCVLFGRTMTLVKIRTTNSWRERDRVI